MPSLLSALAGDPELEALLSDEAQIAGILRFEVALARAEAHAGLIDAAAAEEIATAAAAFTPDWPGLAEGLKRDGVVVPALLAQFRATLSYAASRALHKGATSQDALDTALVLQLSTVLPVLLTRIDAIHGQLADLVARHGSNGLMAHTRMQVALPFTVADKIATWTEPLQRHRSALGDLAADLLVVQLGGPVGDRSTFDGQGDAIAEHVAAELGLGFAPAWHTSRDRIVGLGSRLAMLTGTLGKLGADVALMAQTEVGAILLAGGGMSSAMPHKANPVDAELLIALAQHAAGLAGTLQHAMIHENERSGAAWTLEWLTLAPLIVTAGSSLATLSSLLAKIQAVGSGK